MKIIPEYSRYAADEFGQVFDCKRNRYLKQSSPSNHNVYMYVSVMGEDGFHHRVGVHILICLAFHGPKPSWSSVVRHIDGDSKNNTPNNLRWGTEKENREDRLRHGTYGWKLTKEDVEEIRRLYSTGRCTYRELSIAFKIHVLTVGSIIRRESWVQ